jgi:hypothetical protein
MNINDHLRGMIRTTIVNRSYPDEQAKLDQEKQDIAMVIYRQQVSVEQEATMRSLPRDYFRWDEVVEVYVMREHSTCAGYRHTKRVRLSLGIEKPMPAHLLNGMDGDLFKANLPKRIHKMLDAEAALEAKRKELGDKTQAALNACRTLKQLLTMWPEVREFLPPELLEAKPKMLLPAVPIDDLKTLIKKACPKKAEPVAA